MSGQTKNSLVGRDFSTFLSVNWLTAGFSMMSICLVVVGLNVKFSDESVVVIVIDAGVVGFKVGSVLILTKFAIKAYPISWVF